MAIYDIEIVNFEKYNGRKDQKRVSWFRHEVGMMLDPVIQKLNGSEFKVWIWICEGVTQSHPSPYRLDTTLVQRLINVRAEFIHSCISLMTVADRLRTNEVKPTKGLRLKSGRIRALRTNVTNDTYDTDGEIRTISPEAEAVPKTDLFEIWNTHRGELPKAAKLTDKRRDKCKLRLAENPDPAFWETAVKNLATSEFAKGSNWAGFDWLIENDTNAVKAFEGKYGDKKAKPRQPTMRELYDAEQARLAAEQQHGESA